MCSTGNMASAAVRQGATKRSKKHANIPGYRHCLQGSPSPCMPDVRRQHCPGERRHTPRSREYRQRCGSPPANTIYQQTSACFYVHVSSVYTADIHYYRPQTRRRTVSTHTTGVGAAAMRSHTKSHECEHHAANSAPVNASGVTLPKVLNMQSSSVILLQRRSA